MCLVRVVLPEHTPIRNPDPRVGLKLGGIGLVMGLTVNSLTCVAKPQAHMLMNPSTAYPWRPRAGAVLASSAMPPQSLAQRPGHSHLVMSALPILAAFRMLRYGVLRYAVLRYAVLCYAVLAFGKGSRVAPFVG